VIEVRELAPDDIPQWLALRAALWPDVVPAEHSAEAKRYFTTSERFPGVMPELVLVAVDRNANPTIPGFVELSRRLYAEGCESSPVGFLEGWYVVPGRRREGIGRALVRAGESWAVARGCREFASDALADNAVSRAAHQAIGFEEVEVIRCFRKDLPAAGSRRAVPHAAAQRTMTVGLIGGLGPESTIDYYRRILDLWRRYDPASAPSMVIDSLDVQRGLQLVSSDLPALTEYLLDSVRRLSGAGADFVAITANTPHIVFDEMTARSPIPLLSIVEVCAEDARRRGLVRLALLGTRFTMDASFYPDVFARHGLVLVIPNETERAWIHERYIGQLLKGEFRDDTRQGFLALVGRLRDEERIDGVILGGTELPLLLRSPEIAGLPALDTTALHVDAIVGRMRRRPGAVRIGPVTE